MKLLASRTTGSGYLKGYTLSFLPGTVHASLERSVSPAHEWHLRNLAMKFGNLCLGHRIWALSASGLPIFAGNSRLSASNTIQIMSRNEVVIGR